MSTSQSSGRKSKQEQAAASKLRMEKRGEKLDAAKDKLAKQKPPEKAGPHPAVGRTAGGAAHGFVHGKIYENEQENVGIEGPTAPSWWARPPCGMAPGS